MPLGSVRDAEPGDRGDIPRGGTGGTLGTGDVPVPVGPQNGDASPLYPTLVYRDGFWFDTSNGQWYNSRYQKISDPTISRPGPVERGGLGPEGTAPPGAPDPGDGPIAPGPLPIRINQPAAGPAIPPAPTSMPPAATSYLPVPAAWSGSGDYQLANPMPQMPGMGTASMSPYQAWSRGQGTPTGQPQPFRPWGFNMGALSQALRFGGPPGISSMGGYAGQTAPPPAPPPVGGGGGSGTTGGLPGRTGGVTPGGNPTGGTLPAGGGGSGLPGRQRTREEIAAITNALRDPYTVPRNVPNSIGSNGVNSLTVDQIRLLIATQGAALRG